jgi:hypothetical protein
MSRWPLTLLRVLVVVHAVTAFVQPMLAGAYLDGSSSAMSAHAALGMGVATVCLLQLGAAVVYLAGTRVVWPAALSFGLLAAEGALIATGSLVVHIPLGVAIIGTSIGFAIWAVRVAPRPTEVPA